jgi:hypothetical protein
MKAPIPAFAEASGEKTEDAREVITASAAFAHAEV